MSDSDTSADEEMTESCGLSPGTAVEAMLPQCKGRVALLLNRNAKGVTDKVVRRLRAVVGEQDCFICCSFSDAEAAIKQVLDRNCYAAIACGGGDGTLTTILNMLAKEHGRRSAKGAMVSAPPALAVLRLGTGNALSPLVGASSEPLKHLRDLVRRAAVGGASAVRSWPAKLLALRFSYVEGEYIPHQAGELQEHEVLEAKVASIRDDHMEEQEPNEQLCFFAGLGFDALMLEDYFWLKKKTDKNRVMRKIVHSPLGYLMALFMRTLPTALRGEHIFHARVINVAEEAYYVDPRRGDWALPRRRGEVLYEGPVGIVSVGAVPFYGAGFKLFPFAGVHGGLAHLRLSNVNPLLATMNIASLWNGSYRNPKRVTDFLVKDVIIELDRAVPLQQSGDLVGEVRRLHIKVPEGVTHGTQLVDFMKPLA